MKRRLFIQKSSAVVASAGFLPVFGEERAYKNGVTDSRKWAYNSTELETVILTDEIEQPLTVLQITDSHISCDNENDSPYEQYSLRMKNAYPIHKHWKTKEPVLPLDGFKAMMGLAQEAKADLIVLTGDITNYPSETAIDALKAILQQTGIPYLYTPGNHDWHYEGMTGSADRLRDEWSKKRLQKLCENNTLYSSSIMNGINFVTIDNSTYQINEEQLSFFKQQLTRKEPVVLFVHIPIYMPGLGVSSCGHPDWGYNTDKGYEIERRERWAESNSPHTVEFIKQITNSSHLMGIFSGHWHKSRTVIHNNTVQYITGASLSGDYRLIRFVSP